MGEEKKLCSVCAINKGTHYLPRLLDYVLCGETCARILWNKKMQHVETDLKTLYIFDSQLPKMFLEEKKNTEIAKFRQEVLDSGLSLAAVVLSALSSTSSSSVLVAEQRLLFSTLITAWADRMRLVNLGHSLDPTAQVNYTRLGSLEDQEQEKNVLREIFNVYEAKKKEEMKAYRKIQELGKNFNEWLLEFMRFLEQWWGEGDAAWVEKTDLPPYTMPVNYDDYLSWIEFESVTSAAAYFFSTFTYLGNQRTVETTNLGRVFTPFPLGTLPLPPSYFLQTGGRFVVNPQQQWSSPGVTNITSEALPKKVFVVQKLDESRYRFLLGQAMPPFQSASMQFQAEWEKVVALDPFSNIAQFNHDTMLFDQLETPEIRRSLSGGEQQRFSQKATDKVNTNSSATHWTQLDSSDLGSKLQLKAMRTGIQGFLWCLELEQLTGTHLAAIFGSSSLQAGMSLFASREQENEEDPEIITAPLSREKFISPNIMFQRTRELAETRAASKGREVHEYKLQNDTKLLVNVQFSLLNWIVFGSIPLQSLLRLLRNSPSSIIPLNQISLYQRFVGSYEQKTDLSLFFLHLLGVPGLFIRDQILLLNAASQMAFVSETVELRRKRIIPTDKEQEKEEEKLSKTKKVRNFSAIRSSERRHRQSKYRSDVCAIPYISDHSNDVV
jgi:hypothetical protein